MKFNADHFCRIYFWLLDSWVVLSYLFFGFMALSSIMGVATLSIAVFLHVLNTEGGADVSWWAFDIIIKATVFGSAILGMFIYLWIQGSGGRMVKWLRGGVE